VSINFAAGLKRSFGIPVVLNSVLVIALGFVQLTFLLAPGAWAGHGWLTAVALVGFWISAYAFWALLHEAVHGLLHPHRGVNRAVARLMGIVHGCPFTFLRTGHLLHHRYNRIEDFAEAYDPQRKNHGQATAQHWVFLLAGYYVADVLANVMVWLPERTRSRIILGMAPGNYGIQLHAALSKPRNLKEARLDACATVALFAASAWAFWDAWAMFAAVHLVRAFALSLPDSAYHYDTPANAPDDPAPSNNLALGPSWLILNFNYHGVHHANPSVPWYRLPAAAKAQNAVFRDHYTAGMLRQFMGPIPKDRLLDATPAHGTPLPEEQDRLT
jgi:fatty acid desaturase